MDLWVEVREVAVVYVHVWGLILGWELFWRS